MPAANKLKVGFMGTPDFALAALKAICGAGHDVACVYSQPPRPKGRGQQVQPSPVHAFAEERGIPVFTPATLKKPETQGEFAAHGVDVAVVAAYGLILPRPVLDAPRFGCINIHASLLPRWRGASPIQRAIWAGDDQSGVTLMQMDEGLDTGPEIMKEALALTPEITAAMLHDALAGLGGRLIVEALDRLAETRRPLPSVPQDGSAATYAALLKKDDGRVDWSQSAQAIDRQIRALNPWPGVWTQVRGGRLKILSAAPAESGRQQAAAGTLLDETGRVACGGGGILKLLRVQPESTKAMDAASAMNGGYLKTGDIFS